MPQILFFFSLYSLKEGENQSWKPAGQGDAERWYLSRAWGQPSSEEREEGGGEVWMVLPEGVFLTVPKIKGLTFLQRSNRGGRVAGSWIRWFTNVCVFSSPSSSSASGSWNSVFMPLNVSHVDFSNQRICEFCNFFILPPFFSTRFSPSDGFDLGFFRRGDQLNCDIMWM